MKHERLESELSAECRRHRASSIAWDAALESGAPLSQHARACTLCRAHDEDIAQMRREIRAFAHEPALDLWPAIHARVGTPQRSERWPVVVRWPAVFLRAAGVVVGFGAALGALCALDAWSRAPAPIGSQHSDPFAALREPAADRSRVESAPELQLLALIADTGGERR